MVIVINKLKRSFSLDNKYLTSDSRYDFIDNILDIITSGERGININPTILVRNITIALYTHYLDPHLQNRFF